MVHRDLKPPNFLVYDLEGGKLRCKVADYDLAVGAGLYSGAVSSWLHTGMLHQGI